MYINIYKLVHKIKFKYLHVVIHLNFTCSKKKALHTGLFGAYSYEEIRAEETHMWLETSIFINTQRQQTMLKYSPFVFLFCISGTTAYSCILFTSLSETTHALTCLHTFKTIYKSLWQSS